MRDDHYVTRQLANWLKDFHAEVNDSGIDPWPDYLPYVVQLLRELSTWTDDDPHRVVEHGWWANSASGSVAHYLIGSSSVNPVCDRVVIHPDAYYWPDGPKCKRCLGRLGS